MHFLVPHIQYKIFSKARTCSNILCGFPTVVSDAISVFLTAQYIILWDVTFCSLAERYQPLQIFLPVSLELGAVTDKAVSSNNTSERLFPSSVLSGIYKSLHAMWDSIFYQATTISFHMLSNGTFSTVPASSAV